MDAIPLLGQGTNADFTAKQGDALANAELPPALAAAACTRRSRASAVVNDLNLYIVSTVAHGHERAGSARVFQTIGQRLLHDAVGGKVNARRSLASLAFDNKVHCDAGFPDLGRQSPEVSKSWLWTGFCVIGLSGAKHAKHA